MGIEIKEAYDHIEAIKILFNEYTTWLDIDLSYQDYAVEFSELPGKYARPSGRLYIAYANGKPAGCVALRKFDEQNCEMKRLYVRDEFRGMKIGEKLALKVITEGKEMGYHALLLDTLGKMTSARKLYENLGFIQIPAYYQSPIQDTHFLKLFL